MEPRYEIALQIVLAQDDDGTNGATVSESQLLARIDFAREIYTAAGIDLLFEPARDTLRIHSTLVNREFTILTLPDVGQDAWSTEPVVDGDSHNRARDALARLFPRKLVVVFRQRVKFVTEDGVVRLAGRGGSSSWASSIVNMPGHGGQINLLAHELGHYLQIRHPFISLKTVAQARERIRAAVDGGKLSPEDGLNALDGDRIWVTDTPADATSGVFADAGLPGCGPPETLPIEVTFADGSKRTYELAPDRGNIMAYYGACAGSKHVSAQQARRIRDGVEMGLRQELLGFDSDRAFTVSRVGTAAGETGTDIAVMMLRAGRVVTAERDSQGRLAVRAWDLPGEGSAPVARGSQLAGVVGAVAVAATGLGKVVTAVRTNTGKLKIIIWVVRLSGTIRRQGSAERDGAIGDVAIVHAALEHVVTASHLANGTVRLDLFRVDAEGNPVHRHSITTGTANSTLANRATPRLSLASTGSHGVLLTVRLGDGTARAIPFVVNTSGSSVTLERVAHLDLPFGAVGAIAAAAVGRETVLVATQGAGDGLRLTVPTYLPDARVLRPGGTAEAGQVGAIALCRLANGLAVTAVKDSGGRLKVILWRISHGGDRIVRRAERAGVLFSECAMAPAGERDFVVALRQGGGRLQVQWWQLRSPRMVARPADIGRPLALGTLRERIIGLSPGVAPRMVTITPPTAGDLLIECDPEDSLQESDMVE